MSIIHLIVGDHAARPLKEALLQGDQLGEEVIVLKDILHVGPLKTEDLGFSQGRSAFWNEVNGAGHAPVVVEDLEKLMDCSSRLSNNDQLKIWLWMAPCPADVCAYFWLLHFLKKHQGRFSVININGLPFLDEQGKLFYPASFSMIPPKEIIKARKLARVITPSEWETDGAEWTRLSQENAGIRKHLVGKQLQGCPIDEYDHLLLELIKPQFQKTNKIIQAALTKHNIPTGDLFLLWRLRVMAEAGTIELTKNDVRLVSNEEAAAPAAGNELQ